MAAARAAAIDTPEQRVGAEPALGRRPVQFDQLLVERALIERPAGERRRNLAIDVGDRRPHALAEVTALVAVAQFERFALARSTRPTAPLRGRTPRRPRRRLPPWDCRVNRGFRGREYG